MDVIAERCAGLDVHRDDVVATVRVPGQGRRRWAQHTRTFEATLAGLAELAAWLADFGVTLVGMEATGRVLEDNVAGARGPASSAGF